MIAGLVRRYHDLTFKAEYAYDYGMPQSAASVDTCFSCTGGAALLGRHKVLHFRVWYRDALSNIMRNAPRRAYALAAVLGSPRSRENRSRPPSRGRNYTSDIHTLLTVELIHRLFIDS